MATKVSLGFAKLADTELDNLAQAVIDAMTGNATYPTPPVTMANLKTAKDDFTAKMAAAQTGGIADTAAKNNSRQALLGDLRRVATYVPMTCNDDPALLLSSGFQTPSTNRASTQSLDQKRRVGSTGRDDRSGAQREHVRRAHQARCGLAIERLHRRLTTHHFRGTHAREELHRAGARAWWLNRPIRLERSKFAHGDVICQNRARG